MVRKRPSNYKTHPTMPRRRTNKQPRLSDLEGWGLLYLLPAAQDSRQACMAECVRNARRSAQEGLERVLAARTNKPASKCKSRLERKYGRLAAMWHLGQKNNPAISDRVLCYPRLARSARIKTGSSSTAIRIIIRWPPLQNGIPAPYRSSSIR